MDNGKGGDVITWKGYDKELIKDVCRNCGSAVSQKSFSYIDYTFNRKLFKDAVCECYGDCGFYYAYFTKTHGRLIEIAVRCDYQGQGYGRILLYRLLQQLKKRGLRRLTFRTPIAESAQFFGLRWAQR